jgi:hypothetical protein
MDQAFAEAVPTQMKYLDKLLGGKQTFASKVTAGDLAIATAFNILLALQVPALFVCARADNRIRKLI